MSELPTYQELLAANRQLVAESELLCKENVKLSGLVKGLLEVDEETAGMCIFRSYPSSHFDFCISTCTIAG